MGPLKPQHLQKCCDPREYLIFKPDMTRRNKLAQQRCDDHNNIIPAYVRTCLSLINKSAEPVICMASGDKENYPNYNGGKKKGETVVPRWSFTPYATVI